MSVSHSTEFGDVGEPDESMLADPPDEAEPEDWPLAGGWYHSESEYGLFYKMRGHQDMFAKSWLDLSVVLRELAPQAFEQLGDDEAPGRCTKCHSVDSMDGDQMKVNWKPFQATEIHAVTEFSHRAHFSLGDQEGCQTCHAINLEADFQAGYADHEPLTFASNFRPMTIDTCQQCHTQQQAGIECLTCHQYHVGDFRATLLSIQELSQ